MGKSSLINRLFRAPVVKASPTPGCTKRLQTLFLARRVRLADCPGLIFPKAAVPLGLQLLSGARRARRAAPPPDTARAQQRRSEGGPTPPAAPAGNYPIAQAREPFAAIRYLAETGVHPRIEEAYALAQGDAGEGSSDVPGRWSPFALAEALAIKARRLGESPSPGETRAYDVHMMRI